VGAYIAIGFFVLLVLINGFDVFFPGRFSASSFLTAYVGIPIFFAIYFIHRFIYRHEPWLIPSEEVDLTTGIDVVLANESPEPLADTWQKKLKGFLT